jgi:hypothetical protein
MTPQVEVVPAEEIAWGEQSAPVVEVTSPVDEVSWVEIVPADEIALVETSAPAVELTPQLDAGVTEECVPADEIAPIEESAPVLELTPRDEAFIPQELLESTPIVEVEAAAPFAPLEVVKTRVPFLVAPSFRERSGAPILIHNASSSAPGEARVSPILEKKNLPRIDSCDQIPGSTRFAGSTGFRAQNAEAGWITSAAELVARPESVLPEAQTQSCEKAWRPSDHQFVTPWNSLETKREPAKALDFNSPEAAGLMVRSDASDLEKVDPQQMLHGAAPLDTRSLFLGILETRPFGEVPIIEERPLRAMELSWTTTLSEAPVWKNLPSAWQLQISYSQLRDPIAAGYEPGMAALQPFEYLPACKKPYWIETLVLPSPYVAKDWYRPAAWTQTDFALASFPAEPGLPFASSTNLPRAAAVPAGSLKRGPGLPELRWDLCLPAHPPERAVKLLPARIGAVLPTAKSWPRLGPVPR